MTDNGHMDAPQSMYRQHEKIETEAFVGMLKRSLRAAARRIGGYHEGDVADVASLAFIAQVREWCDIAEQMAVDDVRPRCPARTRSRMGGVVIRGFEIAADDYPDLCAEYEEDTGRSEYTDADGLADGLPGWEPWLADEPEPLDGFYEDDGD